MRPILGFAAALMVATPLLAQRPSPDITSQLTGRVPSPVAQVVRSLADSAASAGVPTAPLVQKALEGAAKGVSSDRIIAALRTLYSRELSALAALRQGGIATPAAADVEGATFALSAGLADSDVSSITRAGDGTYSPASTLRVAGTLAALGVPAEGTVRLVSIALAQGVSPGELATFPASVEAGMGHGMSPAQAAAGLARAKGQANGNNGNGKAKGRGHQPKG